MKDLIRAGNVQAIINAILDKDTLAFGIRLFMLHCSAIDRSPEPVDLVGVIAAVFDGLGIINVTQFKKG